MKKLLAILLIPALTMILVACSSIRSHDAIPTTEVPTEPTDPPVECTFEYYDISEDGEGWLAIEPTEDMLFIQSLFDNIPDEATPNFIYIEQLSEMSSFEYHTTLPYDENIGAYHCASVISHGPMDVVFLRVPEGTDMVSLCDHAKENINPRKEICCTFEYTYILYTDTTALFVMGNGELPEQIQAAFSEKCPDATLHFFCTN